MKIYTKTGDKGETSLIGGTRVKKFDPRLEAYGTIDELNSFIGLMVCDLNPPELETLKTYLMKVQHQLFKIGSHLACEDEKMREQLPRFESGSVEECEKMIDTLEESLPDLKNFILPGGSRLAGLAHICRTICRRSERRLATIKDNSLEEMGIFLFLNRLSDLFFVAARWLNQQANIEDVNWDQSQ